MSEESNWHQFGALANGVLRQVEQARAERARAMASHGKNISSSRRTALIGEHAGASTKPEPRQTVTPLVQKRASRLAGIQLELPLAIIHGAPAEPSAKLNRS